MKTFLWFVAGVALGAKLRGRRREKKSGVVRDTIMAHTKEFVVDVTSVFVEHLFYPEGTPPRQAYRPGPSGYQVYAPRFGRPPFEKEA